MNIDVIQEVRKVWIEQSRNKKTKKRSYHQSKQPCFDKEIKTSTINAYLRICIWIKYKDMKKDVENKMIKVKKWESKKKGNRLKKSKTQ